MFKNCKMAEIAGSNLNDNQKTKDKAFQQLMRLTLTSLHYNFEVSNSLFLLETQASTISNRYFWFNQEVFVAVLNKCFFNCNIIAFRSTQSTL